jgi:hypothetical protein
VAALVASGLAGLPMLVLRGAFDIDREQLQPARGWSDGQWDAAAARLVDDGLLDGAGSVTDVGRRRIAEVERVTDEAAAGAWSAAPIVPIAKALSPIAKACVAELPERTPIGVFRVWDGEADPGE